MIGDTPSLSSLLHQANTLSFDTDGENLAHLVAALRSALSRGIEGHRPELRSFLSLAHRFDYISDTWNASQLLAEAGELDAHAKVARVLAWVRLFPDTARSRPLIVLKLLGDGGTGGISNAALSGILSSWLEWPVGIYTRTADTDQLAGSLLATLELAKCWWPEDKWSEKAPAYVAAIVETTMLIAELLVAGKASEQKGLTRALALAVNLQANLQDEADEVVAQPQVSDAEGLVSPVAFSEEDLAAFAATLNQTKRRIWVVGAIRPKWGHLMGVAKSLGLDPGLFEHVEYQEVKHKPMIQRVNLISDFGLLLGPVPHSAMELGGYSSLATQMKHETGVHVIELRTNSTSNELRISKSSFRSGLLRLLNEGLLNQAA